MIKNIWLRLLFRKQLIRDYFTSVTRSLHITCQHTSVKFNCKTKKQEK